jgi:hypothetical protein
MKPKAGSVKRNDIFSEKKHKANLTLREGSLQGGDSK